MKVDDVAWVEPQEDLQTVINERRMMNDALMILLVWWGFINTTDTR